MKVQTWLLAVLAVASGGCADSATAPNDDPARSSYPVRLGPEVAVTINPRTAAIQVGSSILFTTILRDAASSEWLQLPVTWSSGDTAIATVSEDGLVTGVRSGSVVITATCAGGVGTAQAEVREAAPGAGGSGWAFMLAGNGLAPLYDVWGAAPDDVFAVGSSRLWDCCAVILHFDGAGWSYMDVPGRVVELYGVWGSSGTDVFAVGSEPLSSAMPRPAGVILHYDGRTWSRMTSPVEAPLGGIWGSSSTDVFAVGSRGTVLHYDGAEWTVMREPGEETEGLSDVWGTSPRDVFAVGSAVFHFDGESWTRMSTPTVESRWGSPWLASVWGSASDDVFAVGPGGAILHYDGAAWQRMAAPARDGDLLGIRGNGPTDVYAVGDHDWWGPSGCCSDVLHYDGASWSVLPRWTGQALFSVWTTPGQAFVVGSGPTIIRGRF